MAGYSYVGNDVEAGLFDKTDPSIEFAEKEVGAAWSKTKCWLCHVHDILA